MGSRGWGSRFVAMAQNPDLSPGALLQTLVAPLVAPALLQPLVALSSERAGFCRKPCRAALSRKLVFVTNSLSRRERPWPVASPNVLSSLGGFGNQG